MSALEPLVWAAVAVLGLAVFGLACLVIAAPVSAFRRGLALLIFVAAIAAVSFGVEVVLGNPRDVGISLVARAPASAVLYSRASETEGILLLLDDDPRPVYYRLPWDEETAAALHNAARQAEASGHALMFRYEPSIENRKPRFYTLPTPALPQKPPGPPPVEYKRT